MLQKIIDINAGFWNANRRKPFPKGTKRKWRIGVLICYAVWPGIGLLMLPYTIQESGVGFAALWIFISPWALLMYGATSALIASTQIHERKRTREGSVVEGDSSPVTKKQLRGSALAIFIVWVIVMFVDAATSFKIVSETYWYGKALAGLIVVAFGLLLLSFFVTERQISSKKKDRK